MPDDRVKATWTQPGNKPRSVIEVTMLEPRSRQCNSVCPWRVQNHGKTVEFEYDHEVPNVPTDTHCHFTSENYSRWWDHLKTGRHGDWRNLCHIARRGTWPETRTSLTGVTRWGWVACQCTGSVVLQQRELLRHVKYGHSGLTGEGAARVASDMLGREVDEHDVADLDLVELLEHAHPALLDPEIGSPDLAPLSEHELREWGASLDGRK